MKAWQASGLPFPTVRIALFHNLPSGGAKRTLQEIARRLAIRHQLEVFTLSCANHDFADLRPIAAAHHVFDFAPLPLHLSPYGRLNQLMRLGDLRRLRRLAGRIGREVRRGRFDVAFIHPCQFEKSPSVLRYLGDLPTVYYCQEPLRHIYEEMPARPYDGGQIKRRQLLNRLDPLPSLYHGALKRNDRRNVRRAGMVLVNSRFMQNSVGGVYQVNPQVSYLGVDADFFRPLGLTREEFILSVGSLTPLKGFDFLIRALGHLPAGQRPPLVIASNFQNPPERAYLAELAAGLGVEMRLTENVTDGHLLALYNQARLLAYAPVREPFGLVALEAMACGAAVLAVAEGGVQETVLHEQTGLLVERDPAAFAAALQRLLEQPEVAEAYGRQGRQHVLRQWTWEQSVATLEAHLARAAYARSGKRLVRPPLMIHE